jgi:hypothetical protein
MVAVIVISMRGGPIWYMFHLNGQKIEARAPAKPILLEQDGQLHTDRA